MSTLHLHRPGNWKMNLDPVFSNVFHFNSENKRLTFLGKFIPGMFEILNAISSPWKALSISLPLFCASVCSFVTANIK